MKLKQITNQHLLFFLLTASVFALALAYISQYGFDLEPCILCLHQRKPFFAVIIVTGLALSVPYFRKWQKLAVIFCIFLIFFNAILGLYHVGVEKKIFRGPTNCSNISVNITDLEELRTELTKSTVIRCDEPSFVFLGISMAGWNVIYCLGLIALVFFAIKTKLRN